MRCERCLVSGIVQGVFFRASTQIKADDLGITGYARNLSDGRVEVLACGDEERVKELKDWLWEGPAHAKADSVECEVVNVERPKKFLAS